MNIIVNVDGLKLLPHNTVLKKFLMGVISIKKLKAMILCSMFAALISAGAFVKIPVPVVPFTLQFMFTTLAGLLLGGRLGFVSVMVYVLLGLAGVPVFAQGGGIGYVLQPSFGYLVGFAVGAYVTGRIAAGSPSVGRMIWANLAGLMVVYSVGMIYYALISKFYLGNPIGLWPLFLYCFILAVPGDIAICFAAAFTAKIIIPVIRSNVNE